ncbi:MAG TPA: VWA domain-containing protein [Archaeoglobus profundus]|nr:VWA domain-containing protein [Archaeoglobus profundus]
MLQNNLVNITNKDFIYNLIAERIGLYLPSNIRAIYNSCEHIRIIAADSYFIHYSLYPFLRSKNEDEILEEVRKFKEQYLADERYQRIKTLTTLDDEMSLIYSIALAKTIIGRIMGKLNINYYDFSKDVKSLRLMVIKALSELTKTGELGVVLEYAMESAEEITKNAEEIRELIGGKKAGKEAGTFKKVLDLAEHMMFVKFMRDIITMSKKLAEYIPKASRILKKRGRIGDEISGYALTKKVERALPREIALPDELFLKKLAGEGFLMKEKLSVTEGAYYILIDKSGSMHGEKTIWARSVAIALYRLAKVKKRKYFLRFFDKRVYPKDGPIEQPEEIVDAILKVKSNGGTDITNALLTAIKDIKERGLSKYLNTIVIITDGEDVVQDLSKELKKANASLVSVMIQGDNETLKNLSNQYMKAELTEVGGAKLLRIVEVT